MAIERQKMKKIFGIVMACMLMTSGCAGNKTEEATISPMAQRSWFQAMTDQPAAYGKGLFVISRNGVVYYENMKDPVFFEELSIKDDLPASQKTGPMEKYAENVYVTQPVYIYGDQMVYLTNYTNTEGESRYRINAISIDKHSRTTLLEVDYQPIDYVIQKGYLVVAEENGTSGVIHIYSKDGKEAARKDLDTLVVRFHADGDSVYFLTNAADGNRTYVMKLGGKYETKELEWLRGKEFIFENNGRISYYEHGEDEGDPEGYHFYLADLSGKVLFDDEKEVPVYFDEEHVYTFSGNEKVMEYKVYDGSFKELKTIVPSKTLKGQTSAGNITVTSDFSPVVRIADGQIIGFCYEGENIRYYSCDCDTGACRYLD